MNETININLAEFGGVIAALLVVGAIFKNAFPNFPNRFIPLLTWLVGVLGYQTLTNGWTDAKQWLAAVIAAATATGTHSGIKNTVKGEGDAPAVSASRPPDNGGFVFVPWLNVVGAISFVVLLWIVAAMLWLCAGCARLQPGADALVVRTEQALNTGKASFDFVLNLDNANRPFWSTNLPAFHKFADEMRVKQLAPLRNGGQTNIARCYALLLQADQVKRDYQSAKTSTQSNLLFTTVLTLESALEQAKYWQAQLK